MKSLIKNLTILYVEDDDITREYVTKTLRLLCDNVVCTGSVNEAKKIYEVRMSDIIISDINLGKDSGLDFVKELRRVDKYTPVILLTAHADKEFLLEAVKLNLIDYIIKPMSYEILKNALYEATKYILENGRLEVKFITQVRFNIKKKVAYFEDEIINFTATELKLLEFLLEKRKTIVSAGEIKGFVWEDEWASDGALKSLVNKLRTKIGKESIKNLSGLGYKIILAEQS